MNGVQVALVTTVAVFAVGCGDLVSDQGDLGRLTYTLHVDYEIPGGLRDHRLVTGHTQIIDVGLTRKGEKQSKSPGTIEHRVTPSGGADVLFDPGNEADTEPPAVWITVDAPGSYTLEAYDDGELFDTITLEFARPSQMELRSQIRAPGEDAFGKSTDKKLLQQVPEGAQVAFLTIPLDTKGERLVGQYDVEVSWTPEWAAIQTFNVLDVYEEEGVFGNLAETSLVFVDPATVVVDLVDAANNMTDQITFEVIDNGQ